MSNGRTVEDERLSCRSSCSVKVVVGSSVRFTCTIIPLPDIYEIPSNPKVESTFLSAVEAFLISSPSSPSPVFSHSE